MAIFLFTDFGAADIYVGQVKSVLRSHAPDAPLIDLLHEVPAFDVKSGAHLLAALAHQLPADSVILAVVDPGVGGTRDPVVVRVDNRWYVGPDNGLLSVVAARAQAAQIFPIAWAPERLSVSFHGRDLFAAVAAGVASGALSNGEPAEKSCLDVELGPDDLAEVIYVDHYGNAFTGLRAENVSRTLRLIVDDCAIRYARVFSEVPRGKVFWYENSLGLVEIAANSESAAAKLHLRAGRALTLETA